MKEMVTLNRREQKRLVVLNQVEKGKMIGREAAEVLGLSLRHVRTILAVYRKEGAAALAHGNRGRKPHNALDESGRNQILDLAQRTYAGCNNQHFTQLLAGAICAFLIPPPFVLGILAIIFVVMGKGEFE